MTIEHVPDPAQLCRDACELLAPGGALMLVCHDRRAPLNRALGTALADHRHRAPAAVLAGQQRARCWSARGSRDVDVRRFANRYPLHYWLKLAPVPRRVKRALVAGARRGPLRSLSLSLPVGNLAVTGVRPAVSRARRGASRRRPACAPCGR